MELEGEKCTKTFFKVLKRLLSKSPDRKKICNEHFNLCEGEISLDEIIKSINSKTNNKSPGNAGLLAEFHIQFEHELDPVLLDV